MKVADLIELLASVSPEAEVVMASTVNETSSTVSFHALRDVSDDDPGEVVFWPDPAPLEDNGELPPGTVTH